MYDMDRDDIVQYEREPDKGSNYLSSPLASEESTIRSLASIRNQEDGLNRHRQSLLSRVPERREYASFPVYTVEDKDLAYLSAATGDEFALLRSKQEDILYHGEPFHCHIEQSDTLMELLLSHKCRLEIHSHPDMDKIIPSADDRKFLKYIKQTTSRIISGYTGQVVTFSQNIFDDV